MRIALYVWGLAGGGAERVSVLLMNQWLAAGHEVCLITLADASTDHYNLDPRVRRESIGLHVESRGRLRALYYNLRRVLALRSALKRLAPDVTLSMLTTSNVQLALARAGLPGCFVGSERVHPPHVPLDRLWAWLRRHTYGRLDAMAAQTPPSAAWLAAHTTAREIPVIPNPVTWPMPAQEPTVDPRTVCPDGRRIVLASGRLTEQKGFDLAIAAFARIAARFPAWDLVILGEGPRRESLEAAIRAARLEGRVHLPGRVGNPGDWIEAADVGLLSSRFEGFPNVLLEAMAAGRAVVAFDCETGPREIVRHGVDGLLVPLGDVAALADALARVMGDEPYRAALAAAALEVRTRYSTEAVGAAWETLFTRLLGSRPRPVRAPATDAACRAGAHSRDATP